MGDESSRDESRVSELQEAQPDADSTGVAGFVRRYPVIISVFVLCTLAGIAIGLEVLPEEWALARRIIGGAVGGAGVGLICTAPRIVG